MASGDPLMSLEPLSTTTPTTLCSVCSVGQALALEINWLPALAYAILNQYVLNTDTGSLDFHV